MLTSMKVSNFAAVPYLETSELMRGRAGKLKFSTKKPNVVVGPNGAGKSALLRTLATRFLAAQTGVSELDWRYLSDREYEACWTKLRTWGHDYEFLSGLSVVTDNAPVTYYRPGHIPGNECGITHAMMTGYFDEAREYARLTEDKSSGQQCQALLARLTTALQAQSLPSSYPRRGWRRMSAAIAQQAGWRSPEDYQAEVLEKLFSNVEGIPLVLMDEPEQSLDAKAEALLWKQIEQADCDKVQVIVATHSLYPILNPSRFHVIEAVDGYCAEVRQLMG